jgi:ribose 5-phosphate isomerase B
VGEAVGRGDFARGVVVCGSGIGISIAANRHAGVRCGAVPRALVHATMARAHNDANVLALGARVIGEGIAEAVLDAFIAGPFEGGRHAERVAKIDGGS